MKKKSHLAKPSSRRSLKVLLNLHFRKLGANRYIWDLMKRVLSRYWTDVDIYYTYTYIHTHVHISPHTTKHCPRPLPPPQPTVLLSPVSSKKRTGIWFNAKIPHLVTSHSPKNDVSHKQKLTLSFF